ncbi:MAG: hypothetical protein ACREXW_06665 [Gammaproteobacteria bacterium]
MESGKASLDFAVLPPGYVLEDIEGYGAERGVGTRPAGAGDPRPFAHTMRGMGGAYVAGRVGARGAATRLGWGNNS